MYFGVPLSISLSLLVGKPQIFFTARPWVTKFGLIFFYPGRKLPTVIHFPLQHFKRTHRERVKRRPICKEKDVQRRRIYICPAKRFIACRNYRFRLKSNRSNRAPFLLHKNSWKHFVLNWWEYVLYFGWWQSIWSIYLWVSNTNPTQFWICHLKLHFKWWMLFEACTATSS